ncbi:PAS domain-containing protein [Bernardetia litoralis DSM 6794]|uniref:PAS domain-containing protein n=2 Tax=Bernardetia litoralis TaxID=999 RepID=I4AQG4_BERLS|nr:PAS domain-containing protein [Bernardetia litoralis DSM 6794]
MRNLSNMMCLDIYLESLDAKEAIKIKKQIEPSIKNIKPLLSWDIANTRHSEVSKKEMDIQKIQAFAKKYNWKNDIDAIFLKHHFEAIVLTDSLEKIMWVNEGFTKMTGYSKKFATNKHPSFLQGKMTSKEQKKELKSNIKKGTSFELAIINYKKDKTPYNCLVKIFPLYSNKITHFMALETQVK